jgi:DNA-binding XRE family transcriptional regulator
VAKLLGVDSITVNNWEKGKCGPTLRLMPAIIEFLTFNPLNHSSDEASLGERIRLHRKAHGTSQKKLAKLLGIDWSTVAHWERATAKPSRRLATHVMSFLGIEVSNRSKARK